MRKNIIRLLSAVLVSCSLISLPANAVWKSDSTGWWYSEGNSWATGWRYIDGNWYYFEDDGYMVHSTYFMFNSKVGSYVCAKPVFYNGNTYYFDSNGHMLHDCYIVEGSGGYQYWLNSNGISDYTVYGNKYSGYDLSQVK